jgi:hypothetical protein
MNLSRYTRKFEESEVKAHTLSENIKTLLIKNQQRENILEAIDFLLNVKKKSRIESIEGFAGTFPELRRKAIHDIDIIHRTVTRLHERYNKI